jgi:XTP/dITP diphosphohydrolase
MTRPERLLLATGNRGKLREFMDLLEGLRVDLLSPAEAGWAPEVPEPGETLAENALRKARAGARATGLPTVADDTGLFVDALAGAPGVRSARYAGETASPAENCARLLGALSGVPAPGRGAEFRCEIALVDPGGEERLFPGICRGRIVGVPRGSGGFGYDSLFEAASGRTFAEMSPEEKHRLSHRGLAVLGLRAFLEALAEEGGA